MQAENWAESATTAKPQTRHRPTNTAGDPPYNRPTLRAQIPLTSNEPMVKVVRPKRSASLPASRLPRPPTPMTAKAARLAQVVLRFDSAKLAIRKAGIQAHMAY